LGIALDELKNDDIKVTANGINIVYNAEIEDYINGCEIDFTENFYGKGFSIQTGHSSSC